MRQFEEDSHMENRKTYIAPEMEITVFEYADSTARELLPPSGVENTYVVK